MAEPRIGSYGSYSIIFVSIPDGCKVYYGADTSSITTEVVMGNKITQSAYDVSIYINVIRNSDGVELRFGEDYFLKVIEDSANTYDISTVYGKNCVQVHTSGGDVNFEVSLITEGSDAPAGTDITIGNTIFQGVQGVKHDGVNYDTVEIDGVVYELGVKEITFTVDGTTYQADEGMTWAEWCESEYNTVGMYTYHYNYQNKDIIMHDSVYRLYSKPGFAYGYEVLTTDTIIDGHAYYTGLYDETGSND